MNPTPNETARVAPSPVDSTLLLLARAVAGGSNSSSASWPKLDLADPKQREFGDYELLEEIGRGGMGVVYRARQRSLEREVAIKFIADWFADPAGVARFLAEARAAARLLHPNIVPVHEVGSVEGMHYFSMPLIRGRSLAALLDAGTLQTPATIALLLKLCNAIDYAHRLGLLHLDLKPANVLLDAHDEPLIADFGLARHMDTKGGVDAQEVSGTPAFMAPEQILIKQYRLTPATDIYALGAILYRCLTGVSPHGEGNADDVIRRAAAGRIRPPRELNPKLPRDLDAICMKCLELQPRDRYADVAQLAEDLRRVRDGLPVSVRRAGVGERVRRWFQREPKFALAISFSVLALAIGAAATTWQWREAAAQRDVVKAERDRAAIASEIGAHLFAYSGDDDDRAGDLIGWLRKRLPGDEPRQADALASFARTINAASPDSTATLLNKVVEVLGADYRRRMIAALEAGTDPRRHLYAALIAWTDDSDSSDPKTFATYLQAAIAAAPEDPLVWEVAANLCPGTGSAARCLYPQAAENLVRLDPDNMYAWVVLAAKTPDAQRSREALHEAARRTHFDDYLKATYAAYWKAVQVAGVPAPPLIAQPLQVVAPDERPESGIAVTLAGNAPIMQWQPLVIRCGAKVGLPVNDAQIRSDCLAIGERMMRSDGSLIAQMIAVLFVSTHAEGMPAAEDARQYRRLYAYLSHVGEQLKPATRMRYTNARWLKDVTEVGEMAALQRQARFFGFPDHPPADWHPDDPLALQSSHERYATVVALDRDASVLVAQGKYAEAIAKLTPMEASIRKFSSHGWQLVRFLTMLGRAKLGLHDYAAAQASLSDAWGIANDFGPGSRDRRDCAQALADLYTAWNAAEKDKGYDIQAGQWKQTLASIDASGTD